MKPIIDPRDGDVEDDASSTKRRSLFSLAGSLLVEISLPKLAVAWTLLIGLRGITRHCAAPSLALDWHRFMEGFNHPDRDLARRASIGALGVLAWFAGLPLAR
jgi:hypothetical protein